MSSWTSSIQLLVRLAVHIWDLFWSGASVECCHLVEFNHGDAVQGVCIGVVLLCSGYWCFEQQQLVFLVSLVMAWSIAAASWVRAAAIGITMVGLCFYGIPCGQLLL
ncbi:hypothetical protein U1Q18_017536 [Sarracenia purpurea var. burkii]